MNGNIESVKEQRECNRFRISAPLTLLSEDRDSPGFVRDLSNRGVYFYIDLVEGIPIGSELEFRIELPPEITLSTSCSIRCRGQVVRTDNTSTQLSGIAARITQYSIEREPAN